MIEIKNIHKTFSKVQVLKGLNLAIQSGGIFAILGPNGSGKTTLIKSVLGMVVPDKGSITIHGKSILNSFRYRNEINYLPQIANFPSNLTVFELLGMIQDMRTKKATEMRLIEMFELQEFLHQKLGNLSGGTKQKVNLVLTFMFNSELIILDEPTTGLDPISLLRLKALIKEEKQRGKTILITSHIMSFVEEISDEIVFLLGGKIYFKGTIEQLKRETNETDLEHAIAHILTHHHG